MEDGKGEKLRYNLPLNGRTGLQIKLREYFQQQKPANAFHNVQDTGNPMF